MRRVFMGALLTLATLTGASAAPAENPSITEKAPTLSGVLLFHHYTAYRNWDSQMFIVDLPTGHAAQISKNWAVIHAMNGHFSPDGSAIVFMGSKAGLKDWDVFITFFNGARWDEPIDLTGPNGKRDEDPKFDPDGQHIIYKSDGALTVMDLHGVITEKVTTGEGESSMPYYLTDGSGILYENNHSIMLHHHGEEKLLWGGGGKSAYYPIAISATNFLFTETQANRVDRVLAGDINGNFSTLFFDSAVWDSSDPYPYQDGSRFIFYVTTNRVTGFGGYDLALADLKRKQTWNLWTLNHRINSGLEELGPSWSSTAHYPKEV